MKWISVKDRYPEESKDYRLPDKEYIIYSIYDGVTTAQFRVFYPEENNPRQDIIVKYFSYGSEYAQGVTHWMELPEKP